MRGWSCRPRCVCLCANHPAHLWLRTAAKCPVHGVRISPSPSAPGGAGLHQQTPYATGRQQGTGRESAPLTPPAPAQLQELGTPPQQHQSIPQTGVMGARAVPQGGFRPGTGKERRLGETHEHCCRPPQMKRRDTFSSCHREQRADRCTPSPVRYVRCV